MFSTLFIFNKNVSHPIHKLAIFINIALIKVHDVQSILSKDVSHSIEHIIPSKRDIESVSCSKVGPAYHDHWGTISQIVLSVNRAIGENLS